MKQKRFILLILALVLAPGLGCTPSQPVEPPSVGPTRSNLATSLTSPITPSSRGMAEPAAHLTLLPDGSLLVSDFSAGVFFRIRRSDAAN